MSKRASHLMIVGSRDAGSIRGDDFYASPPEAVRALCSVETFDGLIWEPACGDGAISLTLEALNYTVISTDLVKRGYGAHGIDFLMERDAMAPNIITNPPFKLGEQFAEHAVTLATGKVAFLMRLQWVAGQRRRRLFERTSLSRIWVFSKRLPRMHRHDFEGVPTTSTIDFAWFVWDKSAPSTRTEIGWIEGC